MRCTRCNTIINYESKYCSECGHKVKHNENHKPVITHTKAGDIYLLVMLCVYGAAILSTFVVNLAVSRTLSWFFIVLISVAMAFCITNLPYLITNHRVSISYASLCFFLVLLFKVIAWYVNKPELFPISVQIALLPVCLAAAVLAIIRLKKMNWILKSGLFSIIAAILFLLINPIINFILSGTPVDLSGYFEVNSWEADIIGNKLAFWAALLYGIVASFFGAIIRRPTWGNAGNQDGKNNV